MPVYVFRVVQHKNGNLSWPKECRDVDQAQQHAEHVAAELAQDASYQGCHVEVADEAGKAIGKVAIAQGTL